MNASYRSTVFAVIEDIWATTTRMTPHKIQTWKLQRVGSLAFSNFFLMLLDQMNLNQVNIARGIDWPCHNPWILHLIPSKHQHNHSPRDLKFHLGSKCQRFARRRRFDECWFWISIYHDLALGTLPIRHRFPMGTLLAMYSPQGDLHREEVCVRRLLCKSICTCRMFWHIYIHTTVYTVQKSLLWRETSIVLNCRLCI